MQSDRAEPDSIAVELEVEQPNSSHRSLQLITKHLKEIHTLIQQSVQLESELPIEERHSDTIEKCRAMHDCLKSSILITMQGLGMGTPLASTDTSSRRESAASGALKNHLNDPQTSTTKPAPIKVKPPKVNPVEWAKENSVIVQDVYLSLTNGSPATAREMIKSLNLSIKAQSLSARLRRDDRFELVQQKWQIKSSASKLSLPPSSPPVDPTDDYMVICDEDTCQQDTQSVANVESDSQAREIKVELEASDNFPEVNQDSSTFEAAHILADWRSTDSHPMELEEDRLSIVDDVES